MQQPLEVELASDRPQRAVVLLQRSTSSGAVPPTIVEPAAAKTSWWKRKKKEKKEPRKVVSHLKLFRFADKWDYTLMFFGTAGALGAGATLPAFTLIFGAVIDELGENVDPQKTVDAINSLLLWFFYLAIISLVTSYAEMAFWQWTSSRQVLRLRQSYLKAVLAQEIAFFDVEANPARLLAGVNEDCSAIQKAIGEKVGNLMHNLSLFLTGIAIAFARGWDMTLVILAITPLLGLVGYLMSTVSTRVASKAQKSYEDANSIVTQSLTNVRTLVAFNAEERTIQHYSDELRAPMKAGIVQGMLSGVTFGTTQMVAMLSYAIALWYGGQRVVDGDYTGGKVLTVLFSALIGGFALGQAAPNFKYFLEGRISGARVFEILDRKPAFSWEAPGTKLESVQGHMELKDVDFCYPSRPDVQVFRHFSLRAAAGRTVALVGESGSGKSTVVSLIQRFYDPQAGKIMLDGHDIRSLQLQWYRQQLGLVSQEPTLFATDIGTNIRLGKPEADEQMIAAAAQAANAHEFIARLPKGYKTLAGERGVALSGGQKQRIAIARAILRDPKVLLLDEATSALDTSSERLVQSALNRLMVGRTTIVVAHRLSTVMTADVIAVVNLGTIVEVGSPKELLAKQDGAFSTLIKVQRMGHAKAEERDFEHEDESLDDVDTVVEHSTDEAQLHGSSLGGSNGEPSTSPRRTSGSRRPSFSLKRISGAASATQSHHALPSSGSVGEAVEGFPPTPLPGHPHAPRKAWFTSFVRRKVEEGEEGKKKSKSEPKVKVGYRQLLALNRPEWWVILFGLPASIAVGCVNPSLALTLSKVTAVFFEPDASDVDSGTKKWALVFVGIGIGAFIAGAVQQLCFSTLGQKLGRRVRVMTLRSVLKQEIGWFDQPEHSVGAVASRLSTDAVAVRGAVGDQLGSLAQNIACLAFGLVIAFIADWRMTLVLLATMPLIVFSTIVQVKFQAGVSSGSDDSFAQANASITEAFSAVRTVTAFGMQPYLCDNYRQQLRAPARAAASAAQIAGLGFGFSPFVLFSTYSLGFWFGGTQIQSGRIDFEDVIQVFFAVFIAAFGLAEAQILFPDVAKAKGAVESVFSIIQRAPAIQDDASATQLASVKGDIEFRDVSFAYPTRSEVVVLKNFSLSVPAGKTVAIVGSSGSGKSTIVSMIERFYEPLSGQVLFDGVDISTLRLSWLRHQLGLVNQDPVLFNVSVKDNILYGKDGATMEEVEAAAKAANAHDFITSLPEGYNTKVGELGIQLSGGQKQRVAIARAILRNPTVLLLDEATSALDAQSEALVQGALNGLMVGRTTIVVAHRLSTIRNADNIAVLQQGVILEQGSHEELIAKPGGAYATLVQHQQQLGGGDGDRRLGHRKGSVKDSAPTGVVLEALSGDLPGEYGTRAGDGKDASK